MMAARWSRHWMVFLASFYISLGFLSLAGEASVVKHLPIVALIEYIPIQILKWNMKWVFVICLFVLPVFTVVFLSVPRIASQFESHLKAPIAWSTPFPVVLSAAWIVVFSFLALSEVRLLTSPASRVIFGVTLKPPSTQAVFLLWFYIPIVLAVAMCGGSRVGWIGSLLCGGAFWSSVFVGETQWYLLNEFEFLFLGTGWLFVVLSLLFHIPYFWQHQDWVQSRGLGRWQRLKTPLFAMLAVMLVVTMAGLHFLHFRPISRTYRKPSPALERWIELSQQEEDRKDILILGGTSVDAQGSFAIINDEVVQPGMLVNDYLLEEVADGRVRLSKGGATYWLDHEGNFEAVNSV